MVQEVSHVYFVPGMAADVSIFENIKLPEDQFKMYTIPWRIPDKAESIEEYAQQMCKKVTHDNAVLIGVSFGGVMVQEMSKYLNLKKTIIVSSVKSKHELPKRMKIARKTKIYKILPTFIVSKIDNWERLAFGEFAKKRAALYQKYLSINDKTYLDWVIQKMVCWDQEEYPKELILKILFFQFQTLKTALLLKVERM